MNSAREYACWPSDLVSATTVDMNWVSCAAKVMCEPTWTPNRSAWRCSTATTGRLSSAAHQLPSTVFVPGGAVLDHVRLIERNIRLGKFFNFASLAGTPSISTMREETTGSNSGGAVTLC